MCIISMEGSRTICTYVIPAMFYHLESVNDNKHWFWIMLDKMDAVISRIEDRLK